MRKAENRNEYMRKYMDGVYKLRKKYALEKLGGVCCKCGSSNKLEFDHIYPASKVKTIAKLWTAAFSKFDAELNKCQLLCKKCHRKKTIKEAGKKEAKGTHGTLSSYRYCKCSKCKKAKADYMQSYKKHSPNP